MGADAAGHIKDTEAFTEKSARLTDGERAKLERLLAERPTR